MIYSQVIELLKEKSLTIGSIESLTGGLFASTITNYSGVSKVFRGSIVSYSTDVKKNVVGVSDETIQKYGVVSKECALEMAKKGQKLLETDIVVSFTGNAGPDAMENKEVGLVYIGLIYNQDLDVFELKLSGSRENIRKECVEFAFRKIFEKISRTF